MGFKLPFFNNKAKKSTKQPDPDEVLLALDVGTRYIKAVVFRAPTAHEVEIIGYARVAQRFGAMRDAIIVNLSSVIEACDLAVGKALDIAEKREQTDLALPRRAAMGIAGELVKGVSIVANYTREEPDKKITEKELNSVIDQVRAESFNSAVEEIAQETGVPSDQIQEISTRVDSTTIDGTIVEDPHNLTGEQVSYRVYSTYAPKLHINSLYELANQLGLDEASVFVEPYAIARALPDRQTEKQGAVIVDMGGGTTDVAVVQNGAVIGTKMFAFGGDVLTKRIAEQFNLELPAAEEKKLAYSDEKLPVHETKQIKQMFTQDLHIWAEGVQIALEEIVEDEDGDLTQLPMQIYLCGGGVALPEIREVMLSHGWLNTLPFAKFPKINYIFPNQLIDISDQTGLLIEPGDVTPISIARMYIDKN